MTAPLFAIVVGEASGDTLGADLMRALKTLYPDAHFEGIGGPKMIAEGFVSLYPMDRLSVMGLVEPLKRLPELLGIRRALIKKYRQARPAAFIGIDSPDFNLGIEKALRKAGVKTVHYVSPSVWAWRQGRIKKIKRGVDLMLTLFPFEADFYRKHQVPVCQVGHPLALQLSGQPDKYACRQQLGLEENRPTLCIMPGSRGGEIAMMGRLFLDVACDLKAKIPALQLVIPAANDARHQQLQTLLEEYVTLDVTLIHQQSHQAMAAADVVLLTSGTTALEAMLLNRPMIVSYKLGNLSYKILGPLIKTPFVAIPNLLASRMLVPELLQDQATVANLSGAVMKGFDPGEQQRLSEQYMQLRETLALPSGELAANAIAGLIA